MSLSLKQNEESVSKDSKSAILLNKYLTSAVIATQKQTKMEARKTIKGMVKDPALKEVDKKDIAEKQAEIKEDLKKFGLKEKMAYYANLNVPKDDRNFALEMKVGAVAYGALTAAALFGDAEVISGVGVAVAAYSASNLIAKAIGAPKNEDEKAKNMQYADLKHAQVALKKLSSHFEKEELKEMKRDAMMKGLLIPSGRGGCCY